MSDCPCCSLASEEDKRRGEGGREAWCLFLAKPLTPESECKNYYLEGKNSCFSSSLFLPFPLRALVLKHSLRVIATFLYVYYTCILNSRHAWFYIRPIVVHRFYSTEHTRVCAFSERIIYISNNVLIDVNRYVDMTWVQGVQFPNWSGR